jgi:phage baseplate assembly protein gpV
MRVLSPIAPRVGGVHQAPLFVFYGASAMAKLTDVMGRPFSGIVPYCVVGLVTDNVDPDELARIQVKFPTLHEEPLSFWLRQVSPNAGKERGLYSLPEKEDEVLVIFMQGSHDVGVIIGQFWNGVDIPPQECKDALPTSSKTWTSGKWSTAKFTDGTTDLAKNDRRFWKSRSGHLFVFDDSDGKETVQIWDNSHTLCLAFDTAESLITLTNEKGDIHIRTKTDLYLEAGNDIKVYAGNNIEGESKMDTKHEAGMKIEVESKMDTKFKAGMNFKVEATMNFEVKASLVAKLEGSLNFEAKGGLMAKVEGGAMTQVKGGIVMIN